MAGGACGQTAAVDLLDAYTGTLEPGGPAARLDLDDVSITKMAVSEMNNNVYLLVCRHTGEALLVDAADDAPRILDTVDTVAARDKVTSLATTHKHWDHVRALADVAGALPATTYAGELDAPELPVAPDRTVGDDDEVRFGDAVVSVIHLSGHTPGSIALAYRPANGATHLFTGDSLFPGGPGKTWSPEDFTSLMNDLEHKIFSHFDDDTVVHPGHGDDTVLGTERPHLAEWRERGW